MKVKGTRDFTPSDLKLKTNYPYFHTHPYFSILMENKNVL